MLDVVHKHMNETRYPFQWRYIISPTVVFFLSVLLYAIFFNKLPEQVAYRFDFDGEPSAYMSDSGASALFLGIQAAIVIISFLVIKGISKLRFLTDSGDVVFKPDKLLTLMGNIPVIPQLIFAFALLDMLTYNAYELHLMPLWIFTAIVLVISAVVLGILTIPALLKVWKNVVKDNK